MHQESRKFEYELTIPFTIMKRKTSFVFFVLCFIFTQMYAQTTDPRMLIKQVQDKLKASKSISYDIKYRTKLFSHDDTMAYEAHVDILRVPEDSLCGCYIYVRFKSGSS